MTRKLFVPCARTACSGAYATVPVAIAERINLERESIEPPFLSDAEGFAPLGDDLRDAGQEPLRRAAVTFYRAELAAVGRRGSGPQREDPRAPVDLGELRRVEEVHEEPSRVWVR